MHLIAGVSAVPSARAHARFFRGCCVKGAQIIGRLPCRRLLARTRITSAHQAFAALILRRALQVGRGKSSLGRGRQRERAGAHEGHDRELEHPGAAEEGRRMGRMGCARQWGLADGMRRRLSAPDLRRHAQAGATSCSSQTVPAPRPNRARSNQGSPRFRGV